MHRAYTESIIYFFNHASGTGGGLSMKHHTRPYSRQMQYARIKIDFARSAALPFHCADIQRKTPPTQQTGIPKSATPQTAKEFFPAYGGPGCGDIRIPPPPFPKAHILAAAGFHPAIILIKFRNENDRAFVIFYSGLFHGYSFLNINDETTWSKNKTICFQACPPRQKTDSCASVLSNWPIFLPDVNTPLLYFSKFSASFRWAGGNLRKRESAHKICPSKLSITAGDIRPRRTNSSQMYKLLYKLPVSCRTESDVTHPSIPLQ